MNKLLLSTLLFFTTLVLVAQVGIGTANSDASAVLEIKSTTKGFLPPRVADETTIATPATGLIIYNTTESCLQLNIGTPTVPDWQCMGVVTIPTPKDTTTTIVDVPGQNGTVWMDRNLGATQQATGPTDAAAYGHLYQWGRAADGHQIRTSATAAGPVASGSEGANYIIGSSNWLSAQDNTLWQAGNNDPCPTGYRIPTSTELDNERSAFATNDAAGAASSTLALPTAGYRDVTSGTPYDAGSHGYYWSSTVSDANARYLFFNNSDANINTNDRAYGFSVRCIKE